MNPPCPGVGNQFQLGDSLPLHISPVLQKSEFSVGRCRSCSQIQPAFPLRITPHHVGEEARFTLHASCLASPKKSMNASDPQGNGLMGDDTTRNDTTEQEATHDATSVRGSYNYFLDWS